MPDRPRPLADLVATWATVVGEVDPLTALRATRDLREQLARWEAQLAREALANGATWDAIGAALGTSRQAAWERLRPRIAEAIEAERARLRTQRDQLRQKKRRKGRSG